MRPQTCREAYTYYLLPPQLIRHMAVGIGPSSGARNALLLEGEAKKRDLLGRAHA